MWPLHVLVVAPGVEFIAKGQGQASERAEAVQKLREAEVMEMERLRAEEVGAGLDG
jgi:hypothetical protein